MCTTLSGTRWPAGPAMTRGTSAPRRVLGHIGPLHEVRVSFLIAGIPPGSVRSNTCSVRGCPGAGVPTRRWRSECVCLGLTPA